MKTRVAINGFGRIGRLVLRALIEQKRDDIEVVLLNSPGATDVMAHLLEFDERAACRHKKLQPEGETMNDHPRCQFLKPTCPAEVGF